MLEIGTREKAQPPPAWVLFQALTEPNRDPARPWLALLHDEHPPTIVEAKSPTLVVWSSIWNCSPDARVRFDITAVRTEASLRWTLLVDEPDPGPALTGHMCKRLDQLINAELRYSFGQ